MTRSVVIVIAVVGSVDDTVSAQVGAIGAVWMRAVGDGTRPGTAVDV